LRKYSFASLPNEIMHIIEFTKSQKGTKVIFLRRTTEWSKYVRKKVNRSFSITEWSHQSGREARRMKWRRSS